MKPLLLATLLLASCVFTPKQSEPVRTGVYATRDSINAGRFDLADTYSEQTVRLVPPPKKRVVIRPIER